MHVISIDASKGQLSKLKRGHPVRVKRGTGFNVIVRPETYNLVSRAFTKNKGVQLALSPEEITANREMPVEVSSEMPAEDSTNLWDELPMSGKGIFGRKFDKFVERKLGKKKKKEAYTFARDYLNPIARSGIEAGMAAGTTALIASNPELAPVAVPASAVATELMLDYLDNPSKYNTGNKKNIKSGVRANVGKTLADHYARARSAEMMNEQAGTNYDYMGRAGIGQAEYDRLGADLLSQSIASRYSQPPSYSTLNQRPVVGGEGVVCSRGQMRPALEPKPYYTGPRGSGLGCGLGAGLGTGFGRKVHSLNMAGRGTSITSSVSDHPAISSQPLGSNYQMKFFLPPAYQIHGSGLGGGLYV